MNKQDLINKFCIADLDVNSLARSAGEFINKKSDAFIQKMSVISESALYSTSQELLDRIETDGLTDSVILLSNGVGVKTTDICLALQDIDNDIEQLTVPSIDGNINVNVGDAISDINDQYVNLVAMSAAVDEFATSRIDETTQRIESSFSNFTGKVTNSIGNISGYDKEIISQYYNTITNGDLPLRDRLQSILDSISGQAIDFDEQDSDSPIDFFETDASYTGITPWTAWCIDNNLSWETGWEAIKSVAKATWSVVSVAFSALTTIATNLWNKVTQPFRNPQAIGENSKYTNNFLDIPVCQGMIKRSLFINKIVKGTWPKTIGEYLSELNIDISGWLESNDRDGTLCLETSYFRFCMWKVKKYLGVDYSNDPLIGYIVNIAPTSFETDQSGNLISHMPIYHVDVLQSKTWLEGHTVGDQLSHYSEYSNFSEFDLENNRQNFYGIVSALFNIQTFTGSCNINQNWLDLDLTAVTSTRQNKIYYYDDTNTALSNSSFQLGGYLIYEENGSDSYHFWNGSVIKYLNDSDMSRSSPTNADFLRVICGGDPSAKIMLNEHTWTDAEDRDLDIVFKMMLVCLQSKIDTNLFVPYRHIAGLGMPRYTLLGDTSRGTTLWLVIAAITIVLAIVVSIRFKTRKRKRNKLAKLAGEQWKQTDDLSKLTKKDAGYKQAINTLSKTNRRIARTEKFFDKVDDCTKTGFKYLSDTISNTVSDISTNEQNEGNEDIKDRTAEIINMINPFHPQ